VLLFGLLGAVALAVDVGSWYQRSSQLQKAADAAVLSGVVAKVEASNVALAEQKALEIIAQNGIDTEETIQVKVNGVTVTKKRIEVKILTARDDQYKVQIIDHKLDSYFAGALGITVMSRSSIAQLNVCERECYQRVQIPKPHLTLNTTGTGDGYIPIFIEDDPRLFAINHKTNSNVKQVVCIDRRTNAPCEGYPRGLQTAYGATGTSGTNVFVNNKVMSVVIGRKIYIGGQGTVDGASWSGIACWDTATDAGCGFAKFAQLAKGSGTYPNRGGGPALVNGNLYGFTDDGKIHCVSPTNLASECTGYPKPSALEQLSYPLPDYVMNQNGVDKPLFPVDHEVVGTKVYWTMHYRAQKWTSGPSTGSYIGSRLHCWDTATNNACSGFGVKTLPWRIDSSAGGDASLFVRYSTSLAAEGVCVLKMGSSYKCYTLAGADMGSLSSALHAKFSSNLERYQDFTFQGKTFFPGQWDRSEIYCWDWKTSTSCGDRNWKTWPESPLYNNPIVANRHTGDYGYTSNGRCLIGMGHTNVWWTFGTDLGPCRDTSVFMTINRCLCDNGLRYWGDMQLNGVNLSNGDFTKFTVIVRSPDGTVLATHDMLNTDGVLPLSELNLSTATDQLILELDIQTNATFSAWAGDKVPEVEIRYRESPSLVS
jgi:hypothetical protein